MKTTMTGPTQKTGSNPVPVTRSVDDYEYFERPEGHPGHDASDEDPTVSNDREIVGIAR